jgi:hypothetical protein
MKKPKNLCDKETRISLKTRGFPYLPQTVFSYSYLYNFEKMKVKAISPHISQVEIAVYSRNESAGYRYTMPADSETKKMRLYRPAFGEHFVGQHYRKPHTYSLYLQPVILFRAGKHRLRSVHEICGLDVASGNLYIERKKRGEDCKHPRKTILSHSMG